MNNEKTLDISWETILKISLVVIVFYLLGEIRDILIWFIFALIISVLFNPLVDFFRKLKIPRSLATIFVYVLAFSAISFLIYLTVPLFSSEIKQFLNEFPQYFEKTSPPLYKLGFKSFESIEIFKNSVVITLERMTDNIFNALFVIFGGILSTIFIITTAIFLSLEERGVEKSLALLFPKKHEAYVLDLWNRCEKKVAGWFGTRVLACLFVGGLSYIAFFIFIPSYSFILALIAGIFNFIPFIGPFFTALLIFLIAYSKHSIILAIILLVIFFLIQQIENNLLTPILSKKFIGLPPVLVLISLAVGARLWGLMGAILVVPLAGIIFEFVKEFLKKKKEKEAVVL